MSKKLNIGDNIVVNKDIYRLEEGYELALRNKGLIPPAPKTLEEYRNTDWELWRRKSILYASAGETGKVIDTFIDHNGGYKERVRRFAKVQIGDKIKTFRFTSLDRG